MISLPTIQKFIGRLGTMPYFPSGEAERQAIVEVVLDFAETDAQIDWLGKRFIGLFTDWPGSWELRAVFCSKFRPKDGYSITSRAFGDEGIEKERQQQKLLEGPKLPSGYKVTADLGFDKQIQSLAVQKSMPLISAEDIRRQRLQQRPAREKKHGD